MNLRQLQTLITIADAGGFASAAGRLHLSQPAASRQIQALEAELGVLLFDRIGRRLQLTSEGEDIVRRGRRLLQEADSLRDRADALKGGLTGTLRVGASPQNIETVLAPFVTRFRSKHPGIEVHFVEDGGARISDRLAQGDVQIPLNSLLAEFLMDCKNQGNRFPCCFNDLQLRTETPCDIDATRKRSKCPLATNFPSKNGLSYWRARETRGSARRRAQ
jgi:hypothetical protein